MTAAEVTGPDLPENARLKAGAAYRSWRIGDDGEGRLHAALVAAAPLIRAAERERIAALAADRRAIYPDPDADGLVLPFAELIRRTPPHEPRGDGR